MRWWEILEEGPILWCNRCVEYVSACPGQFETMNELYFHRRNAPFLRRVIVIRRRKEGLASILVYLFFVWGYEKLWVSFFSPCELPTYLERFDLVVFGILLFFRSFPLRIMKRQNGETGFTTVMMTVIYDRSSDFLRVWDSSFLRTTCFKSHLQKQAGKSSCCLGITMGKCMLLSWAGSQCGWN